MNLLDATVTKILSEPYFEYEHWWVDVEYNCWGQLSEKSIMFKTEEEAKSLKVGYEFLT